jgi:hypothetical protein
LAEARAAEEALKAEEEEAAAAAENDMEGSIKSKKSEAKSAGAAEPGAPVEGVEPAAAGDGGDTTQNEGGDDEDQEEMDMEEDYNVSPERFDNWMKVIRGHEFLGPDIETAVPQEFSHVIEIDLDDEEIFHRAKGIKLDNIVETEPENPDDEEKKKPFCE